MFSLPHDYTSIYRFWSYLDFHKMRNVPGFRLINLMYTFNIMAIHCVCAYCCTSYTIFWCNKCHACCTRGHIALEVMLHTWCALKEQQRTVNQQVNSLQSGTRVATNLEIAVHVGPESVGTFRTLSGTVFNRITCEVIGCSFWWFRKLVAPLYTSVAGRFVEPWVLVDGLAARTSETKCLLDSNLKHHVVDSLMLLCYDSLH